MRLKPADRPRSLGGHSVAEALLAPTRLYAKYVQAVLAAGVDVHAMSHITGGGLPGNLPRVLPEGLGVRLTTSWKRPPIIELIAQHVDEPELRRVFNLGIGFVFVLPASDRDRAFDALRAIGETPIDMGEIVEVPQSTEFEARVVFP